MINLLNKNKSKKRKKIPTKITKQNNEGKFEKA